MSEKEMNLLECTANVEKLLEDWRAAKDAMRDAITEYKNDKSEQRGRIQEKLDGKKKLLGVKESELEAVNKEYAHAVAVGDESKLKAVEADAAKLESDIASLERLVKVLTKSLDEVKGSPELRTKAEEKAHALDDARTAVCLAQKQLNEMIDKQNWTWNKINDDVSYINRYGTSEYAIKHIDE